MEKSLTGYLEVLRAFSIIDMFEDHQKQNKDNFVIV